MIKPMTNSKLDATRILQLFIANSKNLINLVGKFLPMLGENVRKFSRKLQKFCKNPVEMREESRLLQIRRNPRRHE